MRPVRMADSVLARSQIRAIARMAWVATVFETLFWELGVPCILVLANALRLSRRPASQTHPNKEVCG